MSYHISTTNMSYLQSIQNAYYEDLATYAGYLAEQYNEEFRPAYEILCRNWPAFYNKDGSIQHEAKELVKELVKTYNYRNYYRWAHKEFKRRAGIL